MQVSVIFRLFNLQVQQLSPSKFHSFGPLDLRFGARFAKTPFYRGLFTTIFPSNKPQKSLPSYLDCPLWKILCSPCFLVSLTIWLTFPGCQEGNEYGLLRVNAPGNGQYEIYRIAHEKPVQLFSEEIGHFNRDISLAAGSYLILGDCSSQMVVITPSTKKELTAHQIQFQTPVKPDADDRFVIQCNRSNYTQDRQMIVNRFKLNILHGNAELLIGMAPLQIDFDSKVALKPQIRKFGLSGVQVSHVDLLTEPSRFFVSPAAEILSVTESQNLGSWLFLMPGDYIIELNGSTAPVKLAAQETIQINPAFLQVSTSEKADLKESATIKGDPLHYEINDGHWLYLNQTYAVLPGKIALRLVGTERDEMIELASGEERTLAARSVRVDMECPPWDWNCLGSKKVFLFNKDQHYPFAQGVTNVPLLYFGGDAWIGLEGSSDLRYRISDETRDLSLKAGYLNLTPIEEYRQGALTDLVRVEATGAPFAGHTLDVPLDDVTLMPLIRGTFDVVTYTTFNSGDGDRRRNSRRVSASFGEVSEINFRVNVSEKKWQASLDAMQNRILNQKSSLSRRMNQSVRPTKPVRLQ